MKQLRAYPLWRGEKVQIGIFFDECWRFNFRLIWNCTDKDLRDYCKDEFDIEFPQESDDWAGRFVDHQHEIGGPILVIALKRWTGTAEDHAMLAHEAFHAATHLLRKKATPLTEQTEEAYAYLVESIIRRCLIIIGTAPSRK